MRNIIWIALNHLKLLAKDRAAYFLLLALPLVLTLVMGLAFGNAAAGSGRVAAVPLAVADLDNGPLARYLIDFLETEGIAVSHCPEAEARELVRKREAAAAVIIPAGFTASLKSGAPEAVTVIRADLRESPGLAEELVSGILYRIRANASAAALGEAAGAGEWEEIFNRATEKWHPSPAVGVAMETVTVARDESIPTGNRQTSPGFVVMFGMMTVITAGSATLLQERQNGTLARLLSAPLNRFQLLSGKTLGLMASGIVQMAVLITAGRLLFNVPWGRDIPALAILVAALSFAATGFGMLLASVCRTSGQAQAVGVLSVLLMSMLGGAWWPVEILPPAMQAAARAVPSGWAMQGFVDLIMRQGGLAGAVLPVLVLLAFGAVFLSLGLALFRYQR